MVESKQDEIPGMISIDRFWIGYFFGWLTAVIGSVVGNAISKMLWR